MRIWYIVFALVLLMIKSGWTQNTEIDSLKSTLNETTNLDSTIELCNIIGFKSMIYSRQEAEYYQQKLDSIWEKHKNQRARLLSHRLKGKILRWNDEPKEALKEFLLVLDLKPDSLSIANVQFNLGMVYSSLHLNDKALTAYKKSISIYKSLKTNKSVHNIYNCIADVYSYNLQDYEQAEKYYLQALSSFSFQDEKFKINTEGQQSLSAIHNNLGVLYSATKQFKKAEEHLINSLSIAQQMHDSLGIFHSSISLAQMYRRHNQYEKSLQILDDFEHEYLNYAPYLQAEFLREWTTALAGSRNYKKAYEFSDHYAIVRDSLYNTAVLQQVTKVEAEYRHKLEEEQLKVEVQKSNNKTLVLVVTCITLVLILLILGLLYLRYHFYLKKEEIDLLHCKNREVLSNAMKQTGFNTILDVITKELQNFSHQEKLQKGSQVRLEELMKQISLSRTKFQWEDFEVLFTRVYAGFLKELNKRHANLTSSERKLCALIKLDLTNLEIANFLNIEPQSVHVAKSRLRKKMVLDKSKDLYYYLNKL
ncbi:tetratricopeptide repeat protein [Puteibacter caeruleilacunae]|nr:tetratricopeptide repeat protein [Puteibacter caeruleilacunae]